jgi:superfamily II DNA or RNA helicase
MVELVKTSLSSQGYAIYKSKITVQEMEKIKEELTITPFTVPGYGSDEDITPYKLYKENVEKLYVPYYYGYSKYGKPERNKTDKPEETTIGFSAERTMRPYQQEIINTYLHYARNIGGGIISVGCGRGKTVMALKIAELLKVKTLILVHKEFLMNQWIDRIKEYLPTARIGSIQGKTLDINRKDIVLAMIQSLSDPRKDNDYPIDIFKSFGLVIADECHHLAARQFSRSLAKYTFKYTLGLSATPNRADNLQRVFKHYLGDIIYKDTDIQSISEDPELDKIPDCNIEVYVYNNNDPKYCKEELNYKRKPNVVIMKSNIAGCEKRTQFILSFLPRLIGEGRNILLLSCRREHIFQMEKFINEMAIPECSVGLYLGGMKQEDLDISATKRVVIATYNMAEEAFDCKALNTLIYATPHNNIEQAVGRILREEKKKRHQIPLIIDIYDKFSSFEKWNIIREKYYLKDAKPKRPYPIKMFEVSDLMRRTTLTPEIKFIKNIEKKKIYSTRKKHNKHQYSESGNESSTSNDEEDKEFELEDEAEAEIEIDF